MFMSDFTIYNMSSISFEQFKPCLTRQFGYAIQLLKYSLFLNKMQETI